MLRQCGVPFEEEVVGRASMSPSGRVPLLLTDRGPLWESLAIGEYLAELFPDRWLWPTDPWERAQARVYAHEMHAGFRHVRETFPMDIRHRHPTPSLTTAVTGELARLQEIASQVRGPYFFGDFGIVDAMFTPVAARFQTWGLPLNPYYQQLLHHPPMREWIAAAEQETVLITPTVDGPA